jgi:hypothetical protein
LAVISKTIKKKKAVISKTILRQVISIASLTIQKRGHFYGHLIAQCRSFLLSPCQAKEVISIEALSKSGHFY